MIRMVQKIAFSWLRRRGLLTPPRKNSMAGNGGGGETGTRRGSCDHMLLDVCMPRKSIERQIRVTGQGTWLHGWAIADGRVGEVDAGGGSSELTDPERIAAAQDEGETSAVGWNNKGEPRRARRRLLLKPGDATAGRMRVMVDESKEKKMIDGRNCKWRNSASTRGLSAT